VYNGKKSSDWKHLQFNVFMLVFILFFYKKVKKHVFKMFFYLQINVFNIYGTYWGKVCEYHGVTAKKTNPLVLEQADVDRNLLANVKNGKLR